MEFWFLDYLDQTLFWVCCEILAIELHSNDGFVALLTNNDRGLEGFRDMNQNFLFSIIIHTNINFLAEVLSDEIFHIFDNILLRGERKPGVAEGIIKPHLVNLFATFFKLLIRLRRRV